MNLKFIWVFWFSFREVAFHNYAWESFLWFIDQPYFSFGFPSSIAYHLVLYFCSPKEHEPLPSIFIFHLQVSLFYLFPICIFLELLDQYLHIWFYNSTTHYRVFRRSYSTYQLHCDNHRYLDHSYSISTLTHEFEFNSSLHWMLAFGHLLV